MRFDGSAALKLDFGSVTTTAAAAGAITPLRLAPVSRLHGPDKYRVLEHRRRRAQIAARRLLDLLEEAR
jgi:hypothetical protein